MSEEMDDLFGDLDRTLESSSEVDEADKVDLSKQAVEEEEFSFLDGEDESFDDDVHVGQSLCVQSKDWPEVQVSGSSVNLVAVIVDDSGSMRYGNEGRAERELKKGLRSMTQELKNISEESKKDIFVVIQGFKARYFIGDVSHLKIDSVIGNIECDCRDDRVVEKSVEIGHNLSNLERDLKARGVSVDVHMLVMADGGLENERVSVREFSRFIEERHYWKVSAIGIDSGCSFPFKRTFRSMGINKIILANPSELRRALYQFSRSVSAV
ncbi:hypothetical protein ACFL2R_02395 [Patescibacteria group bacterium]